MPALALFPVRATGPLRLRFTAPSAPNEKARWADHAGEGWIPARISLCVPAAPTSLLNAEGLNTTLKRAVWWPSFNVG